MVDNGSEKVAENLSVVCVGCFDFCHFLPFI